MHARAGKSTAARVGIYLLFILSVMACFYFMHITHRFSVSAAQGPPVAQVEPPPGLVAAIQDYSAVPAHPEALNEPLPAEDYPAPQALQPPPEAEPEKPRLPRLAVTDLPVVSTAALQAEIDRIRAMGVDFPEELLGEYMGAFHNTAYCCEVYPHICGGNGVTASGTAPTPGLTAAADWNLLPPGTWLYIRNVGIRRVEDSGSAVKNQRLDIAVDTHANALRWWGFGSHDVWVLAWPAVS